MAEREIEVNSYTFHIQSIKMKVKFACKMKLESGGEILTGEVSQSENDKFVFNQEITLKDNTDQQIEIVAYLITDKGSKYIAGVIKLSKVDIMNQEGEIICVNLAKCLDTEATCQLRVQSISNDRIDKNLNLEGFGNIGSTNAARNYGITPKSKQIQHDFLQAKVHNHELHVAKNNHGSRSEYQFPIATNRNVEGWEREDGHASYYQRNRSPITNRKKTIGTASFIDRNLPEFGMDPTNRDKLIQAQVYRDNYLKLKEKYKKEAENAKHELNKRIALENNENNYKLEIMRLKLRGEQNEKIIQEKNNKIKQYQVQLALLQKKELDLDYLREESANKDHTIKILEETIRTLNQENDNIKGVNRDRYEVEQDKIREMKSEIDVLKQKYESKVSELERELRNKKETLSQKEMECRLKDEKIQKEQRIVDDLEKMSQIKLLDFERSLQNQRNEMKSKFDDLKNKYERLETEKSRLESELNESKNAHEKIKSYIIKIEYDKKIMAQETDNFKGEINELKVMKEKYHELTREHKLLHDEKNLIQKQFEKSLQNKESNFSQIAKQNHDQLEHYKKMLKETEEKYRNSQTKVAQLQGNLESKKNENEKLKRNLESMAREVQDLKEKEKSLRRSLKTKEEEMTSLNSQLDSFKYKFRNGDQMSRYQIDSLRDQISKAKRDLDSEALKVVQLTDKNSGLLNDLNKMNMKVQYAEDQAEKTSLMYKEKLAHLESVNRDHERKIDDLNSALSTLRNEEREIQAKNQKLEIENMKNNEKVEKGGRDLKSLEEKISNLENQLKTKTSEITSLNSAKDSLEKKFEQTEEKLSSLKNNLSLTVGEKNKNDKIIQILNREINDLKQENQKYQNIISEKQKEEDELRNQNKKLKEENLKFEMKVGAMKKEWQRFKQQILETLSFNFKQIPGMSHQKVESSLMESISQRKLKDSSEEVLDDQILNRINLQSQECKSGMGKLLEKKKELEKDLEKVKEDSSHLNQKGAALEQNLRKTISRLEDDLQRQLVDKEQISTRLYEKNKDLKQKLEEKEAANNELLLQIEEQTFTINSLGMDVESKNEHFNYKMNQMKLKIGELEEKIQFQNMINIELEGKTKSQDETILALSEKVENLSEKLKIKEKEINELAEEKKILEEHNEDGKKTRKQLLEKISDLELRLNTETELREKGKQLLEEEQHKSTELKDFISTLMKQKENAIKSQLEKGQKIGLLEGQVIELEREKQLLEEEAQRLKKTAEEQKQLCKKLNSHIKDLQLNQGQEKTKLSKNLQKLRDKQTEIKEMNETLERIKEENQKTIHKLQKQNQQLQSELEDFKKSKEKSEYELVERNNEALKLLEEKQNELKEMKNQILILEQNLFTEKQNLEAKHSEVTQLEEQLRASKRQAKNLEQNLMKISEELKEKEERMFELAGKVYNLENRLEANEEEKMQRIQLTNDDWSAKYQGICDQYDQRIELVEKERDYFKERLEEKENEYRKVVAELRNAEMDDGKLKKALEEKVRRLEEDRLAMITSKNNEIQRLAVENKANFDAAKAKQADIRRLQHELDIARSTINKLEQNKKDTEERIKNINKVYQGELDQLKKKEMTNRNNRENINRIHWDIEREMKKILQVHCKKFVSSKQSPEKLLGDIKSLEDEILNLLELKLGEKE